MGRGWRYILLACAASIASCGSGGITPTTPAQIPTTVEFNSVSPVVQMEESLSFTADVDASDLSIAITNKVTGETDEACGVATVDGTDITITAGDNWAANNKSECNVVFSTESSASINSKVNATTSATTLLDMDYRVVLSEARAEYLTFSGIGTIENASGASIVVEKSIADATDSDDYLHVCFVTEEGVYYAKYNYDFREVIAAKLVVEDAARCVIQAEYGRVAMVASRIIGEDLGGGVWDSADRYVYSDDGGATFSREIEVPRQNEAGYGIDVLLFYAISATLDENKVFHVARQYYDYGQADNILEIVACDNTSCDNRIFVDSVAQPNPGTKMGIVGYTDRVFVTYLDEDNHIVRLGDLTYGTSGYTLSATTVVSSAHLEDQDVRGLPEAEYPVMLKLQSGNLIVAWRRERFVMQREDLLNVTEHDLMLAEYNVATSTMGETLMIENDSYIWDHFLFEILGEANNIHAIYRGWTIPQETGGVGVDGYEYILGHVDNGTLLMNDPISTDFVGDVGKIETTMSLAGMAFVSAVVPGDDFVQGVSTSYDFSHFDINFSSGSLP